MKDRVTKSKSPWMKFFVIDSTNKLDDLARSRVEGRNQMVDRFKQHKDVKNMVVK
jgi:hypothetical protein